ncbi:MAG: exonuclease SbcCD subunit D [Bacteroidales bacterium]|nr:exonuclease SbcCD subunit D [Lachnoclostridium sp.]MCM1385365.1 exonuclease SbcCD subunit D [Lachnoclostridium sp.]MCM1466197.1 exonuclease SbcCD subunit D [Bacteroidales bacterium]
MRGNMKMIHCADLHLDSKMNANLDKERAKERKGEILHTFERMVEYAAENQVAAILIAGDLFDTKNISATAKNTVLHQIISHQEINFYYLKGNHDSDNFLSGLEEIPENLKLFGSRWTVYEEAGGKVQIWGLELSPENAESAYHTLMTDAEKFNIVMLHGQEASSAAKDKAEIIPLKALRNKGIDYLALGHIHTYKKEKLDTRAEYCYAGCLEGRGFDECGEHGFVLLDIDEKSGRYTHTFIPFARRKLYTVNVDVTDCETTAEMVEKAETALQGADCENSSLVKIVLKGMLDVECEKDIAYFQSRLNSRFYFVKVYDESVLKIDSEDYLLDESLKGEYVRQVMSDDSLSEEDKAIIIRYGLQALAGEYVE